MKRLKMTEARKRLFQLADEVAESREEVVLTRRGKKDVVLVNEEEWICVKEKAMKYQSKTKSNKSMVGSLILKTKNLEADIRKLREEFTASLEKDRRRD